MWFCNDMLVSKRCYFMLFTTIIITALDNSFVQCRRIKRVVGGKEVPCGAQKQVISIRNSTNYKHLCGGTILSTRVTITSAHCVQKKPENYVLLLNNYCTSDNVTKPHLRVLDILIHPLYDKYSKAHDIAVLQLQLEVGDITWLNDITLPKSSFGISGACTIYGYGVNDPTRSETSDVLAAADLQLISLDQCTRLLGPYVAPDYKSGMICAIGKSVDACQGDSGGPLVCDGKIEGVCAYGVSCGVPGMPGVYVSIGAHLHWITDVIRKIDSIVNDGISQRRFSHRPACRYH